MARPRFPGLMVSLLAACSIATAATCAPSIGQQTGTRFGAKTQTLFQCRTARGGKVRLTLDVYSRALTLIVRSHGEPSQAYALRDVEQGSSPGSGAGGRADTAIRGKGGSNVFTLFAGYDNNGAETAAALRVAGPRNSLLVCDGGQYSAPQVNGLGRFGATNIYLLSADGLTKSMKELPVQPDFNP